MEKPLKFKYQASLDSFLSECEKWLLDGRRRKLIDYSSHALYWNGDKLKALNSKVLKEFAEEANVYAIFSKKPNEEFRLRYIGQTKSSGAGARLTNHLFKKNDNTGAKLKKVKEHVKSGGSIAVSWIPLESESLRHYIEEELIVEHCDKLDWNLKKPKCK